jgi:RNA polymerase sigma-70 factor, ECF subfamily
MTSLLAPSDDALLRDAACGDEPAFSMLYARHQPAIYRFAVRLTGSEAAAADVTQDVFLALIARRLSFDRRKGDLAMYLLGVARQIVRRRFRRESRHVQLSDLPQPETRDPAQKRDRDPIQLAIVTQHERVLLMRRAILSLPLRYREVVVLCHLHGLTYAQAAAVIGCRIGTVRSRTHRALRLLENKLRPFDRTVPVDIRRPGGCLA